MNRSSNTILVMKNKMSKNSPKKKLSENIIFFNFPFLFDYDCCKELNRNEIYI